MILLSEPLQKHLRQRHNIFLSLPECRQGDMNGIDAIIQILPEPAFTHQLLQIHIGSANQADIDGLRLIAAHPYDAPVLNSTKQLRLQVQRNIADFIQEQRPAIGLLELANVVCMSIGECALHVAEQLTFKEGFRNGTRINGHHRLAAPEAMCVYLPRQHILACAVLAGNQHRGIGRCNLIQRFTDGFHRPGRAPEHRSFATLRMTGQAAFCHSEAFGRRISPHCLPGLIPGCSERCHEFVVVPRLHNEIKRTALHSFHRQGNIGISRKQDHFHLRHHLFDFTGPVQPFIPCVDAGVEVHVQ